MGKQGIALLMGIGVLAGCALPVRVPESGPAYTPVQPAAPTAPVSLPELAAPPPTAGARTAEALDTTTPEQRAAATATPAPTAQAALGKLVVSLGDPTAAGFWLKSDLVKAAGGQTVQVELQPGTGAAQMSLAAFRALGLGLTDLPQVEVFPR